MATTAESFQDALAWIGRFLRMAARRAAVMAVVIALFVVAVWWTTRETTSDCREVTAAQRRQLESLLDPDPSRRFRAVDAAKCVDGRFLTTVSGFEGDMEEVTEALVGDGFDLDVEYIPFFARFWRRCFRFPDPDWSRVELNVWASRGGVVDTIDVTAPEQGDACDFLRY